MQKRNRDWFRVKHRKNNFNKTQSSDGRVCCMDKEKILQEVENKIVSLKRWIKVLQTKLVLKQDSVTEYLD